MKQFFISLLACVMMYIIGSLMAANFDVTKWNEEGRYWFGISLMICWLAPILHNLVSGESNFKNSYDNSYKRKSYISKKYYEL